MYPSNHRGGLCPEKPSNKEKETEIERARRRIATVREISEVDPGVFVNLQQYEDFIAIRRTCGKASRSCKEGPVVVRCFRCRLDLCLVCEEKHKDALCSLGQGLDEAAWWILVKDKAATWEKAARSLSGCQPCQPQQVGKKAANLATRKDEADARWMGLPSAVMGMMSKYRADGMPPFKSLESMTKSEAKALGMAAHGDLEALEVDVGSLTNTKAVRVMTSLQTHKIATAVIERARKGSLIVLLAYMYDLREISEALVAAVQRGAAAIVVLDLGKSLEGTCAQQRSEVLAMQAGGVEVRVMESYDKKASYADAGRSGAGGNFNGIHHAKALWCGQDLIIGSTNWTVASKANSELSVQLEVGPEDHAEVAGAFWLAVVRSHAYDEAYTAATYRRRAEEAKLHRDSQSSASGSEGSLWIERTGEIVGDKLVLYEKGERKTEEKASRRWLNPKGLAYAHWRKEAGV